MREMRWWTARRLRGLFRGWGADLSGESGGADEGTAETGVANEG